MDTVDKETRSRIMSSVGQRDTGPEMKLRRALHKRGYRYRLNVKTLPGSPDIVLPRFKAAIFVHGCFWHVHGCKYSTVPSSRKKFWADKFRVNKRRDRRNIEALQKAGWRVMVVWECTMRSGVDDRVVCRVVRWLKSNKVLLMTEK